MLNDDLNRNDRMTTPSVDRTGRSGGWMMLLAAAVVLGLLFMWAPWSNTRTADNSRPQTTVGSSTNRPATPAAPAAREPAIPAAPSTTR